MISLVLVDDHTMVRQGLRAFLATASDIRVVDEAGDAESALKRLTELEPEVALIDLSMPGMSGLDLCRSIVALHPGTAVLILSMYGDPGVVAEALEAGAAGYLLKEAEGEELLEAIRKVASGERSVLGTGVSCATHKLRHNDEPERLTARESEVVALVASGLASKQIARKLEIGIRTVETYRANALRKLRLRSAAELTLYAIRRGLIPPG